MSDGPYPNDFAEIMKKHSGESYQPSNGSEGDCFQEWYCNKCKYDAEYRAGAWKNALEKGCQILAASFWADFGSPEYPKEWIIDENGQPTCTAFSPVNEK